MTTPGVTQFPTATDDLESLLDESNGAATTLSRYTYSTDTTIYVESTSAFPYSGTIAIGSELITYAGTTETSFTGCQRGQLATTAAFAYVGTAVTGRRTPRLYQGLANASINLERKLGTGSSTPASGTVLKGTGSGTSAWSALTSGELTTALGFTPANKAGDTFTGTVTLSPSSGRALTINMTSSGALAINDAGAQNVLNIRGDGNPLVQMVVSGNYTGFQYSNYGSGFYNYFNALKARGTATTPLRLKANDDLFILAAVGYYAVDDVTSATIGSTGGAGRIAFRAGQDWTSTANGIIIRFIGTPNGSTTAAEWGRFHSDGGLKLGNTTHAGQLAVLSAATGTITAALRAIASQSVSILECQNSSGTPIWSIDKAGHPIGGGSTPSIAAGSGAGTSPTVSITGSDGRGLITVTTGTSPAATAALVTVTFATAYASAPKIVLIAPADPNAAALGGTNQVYVDAANISTTQFAINVGSVALAASTEYKWHYQVVG